MRSTQQIRAAVTPRKRVKPRNPKRQAARFAHDYHSVERVEFVQAMPCQACLLFGAIRGCRFERKSDNAHVFGNDGASQKGHYSEIVPLGRKHHRQFDDRVAPFDDEDVRRVIQIRAANVEAEWQAREDRCAGTPNQRRESPESPRRTPSRAIDG